MSARSWIAPAAIALGSSVLGCAAEPATQALVTIALDPALTDAAHVEATVLDVDGMPVGRPHRFGLTGEHAAPSPFSFGAVSDGSGTLRLRLSVVDASGMRVLSAQEVSATLVAGEPVALTVGLSPHCVALACQVGVRCTLSSDAAFTRACGASDGHCLSGDGLCGADCRFPDDADCGRPNGQSCAHDGDCASSQCVDGFCCNDRCARDCAACNRPGAEGICTDYVPASDPQHCGGCNLACDLTQVAVPHCTEATCDGRCAESFGDCDGDQRTNGCETDLARSPLHCGTCGNRCPFGTCADGTCVSKAVGYTTGAGEVGWPPNRMYGLIVYNPQEGMLAGIGIRLKHGDAYRTARVRVGVYRANDNQTPGQRLRTTTEISTDPRRWKEQGVISQHGGLEQAVAPTPLTGGTYYWLFFIADEMVHLATEIATEQWRESTSEIPYAGLSALPEFVGETQLSAPSAIGDLYMVVVPNSP